MIQLSDIDNLSSLSDSLSSLVSIHSENWDDVVFERINRDMIGPIESRMQQIASSAETDIRMIVNIYSEMSTIASNH